MKKLTLVLSVTMLAFVAISVVAEKASAGTVTGFANLHQVKLMDGEQSGVKAKMVFVETATEIKVTGSATGLFEVDDNFFSLFYINSTSPNGPNACIDGFLAMVGTWQVVNEFGEGTLDVTVSRFASPMGFFGLGDIGAVSVRKGVPGPDLNELQACGKVHENP